MKQLALTLAGITLITIGGVTMLANAASAGHSRPALAQIYAFSRVGSDLQFSVMSTGCTKKSDFELIVNSSDSTDAEVETVTVELLRVRNDRCKRMPYAKVITFDETDHPIRTEQIMVMNPFISTTRFKRKM